MDSRTGDRTHCIYHMHLLHCVDSSEPLPRSDPHLPDPVPSVIRSLQVRPDRPDPYHPDPYRPDPYPPPRSLPPRSPPPRSVTSDPMGLNPAALIPTACIPTAEFPTAKIPTAKIPIPLSQGFYCHRRWREVVKRQGQPPRKVGGRWTISPRTGLAFVRLCSL